MTQAEGAFLVLAVSGWLTAALAIAAERRVRKERDHWHCAARWAEQELAKITVRVEAIERHMSSLHGQVIEK